MKGTIKAFKNSKRFKITILIPVIDFFNFVIGKWTLIFDLHIIIF